MLGRTRNDLTSEAKGPFQPNQRSESIKTTLLQYGLNITDPTSNDYPNPCFEQYLLRGGQAPTISEFASKVRSSGFGDGGFFNGMNDMDVVKSVVSIGGLVRYSFCKKVVELTGMSWHCIKCGRCKEFMEWHCGDCGKCNFGLPERPCLICNPDFDNEEEDTSEASEGEDDGDEEEEDVEDEEEVGDDNGEEGDESTSPPRWGSVTLKPRNDISSTTGAPYYQPSRRKPELSEYLSTTYGLNVTDPKSKDYPHPCVDQYVRKKGKKLPSVSELANMVRSSDIYR
ncbi:hypothetical protein HDU76_012001, partial [Blyttiomyces sp. JEL0837]